jgi:signal transduction histidine kinase
MADKPNIEQSTSRFKDDIKARQIVQGYFNAIIFCISIAVFFSLVNNSKPSFLPNLIISLSFGFTINTLIFLLFWLFNPKGDNKLSIVLIFTSSVVGGVFIGIQVFLFIMRSFFPTAVDTSGPDYPFGTVVWMLGICGTITYLGYSRLLLKSIKEAAEKERISRLASETAVIESNLRLLQAQIEPHFLFNTLSNVVSLIDTEPAKGKSMLMDLTSYLRTSLSRTLPETTTLGQEIEVIKAYLNIQKIRLGDRLNLTIDIPANLAQHPFPPMLLQPLVENAVKHGLEPNVEGGEIRITVGEEGEFIRIEVADTGLGFTTFNDPGVGIANVRERINLIYGEKGRLILEANRPNGVKAIIEVQNGNA